MSIPPEIKQEAFSFFEKNIHFNTLQVRKKSGLFGKVNKKSILKYPARYSGIQINSNEYINAMAFDCDHEDVLEYTDFDMPIPSLTVVNKHDGKHHHIFYLKNPIPLLHSDNKTSLFLSDIYNGMSQKLESDKNYTSIITKNYINASEFKIYGSLQKYHLNDFVDLIDHKKSFTNKVLLNEDETSFSRHIRLFDAIRYFGYGIARKCDSYDALYLELYNFAISINKIFENKIKIKYIVNSVTVFCWEHRFNFSNKKWNWDGYKKQDNEVTFENRSKRETKRRRNEMMDKSPLNFKSIKF